MLHYLNKYDYIDSNFYKSGSIGKIPYLSLVKYTGELTAFKNSDIEEAALKLRTLLTHTIGGPFTVKTERLNEYVNIKKLKKKRKGIRFFFSFEIPTSYLAKNSTFFISLYENKISAKDVGLRLQHSSQVLDFNRGLTKGLNTVISMTFPLKFFADFETLYLLDFFDDFYFSHTKIRAYIFLSSKYLHTRGFSTGRPNFLAFRDVFPFWLLSYPEDFELFKKQQ